MADQPLRFVQIVSTPAMPTAAWPGLFGLTDDGAVYFWDPLRGGWKPFPMAAITD